MSQGPNPCSGSVQTPPTTTLTKNSQSDIVFSGYSRLTMQEAERKAWTVLTWIYG